MPRDVGVIGICANVFDIYTDVGVTGNRDKGEIGGVGEVEPEPGPELGAERRLAECVVREADFARVSLEVAPQEVAQDSARDDKPLPITLEAKLSGPVAFITREGRVETSIGLRCDSQTDAPAMHLIGCQSEPLAVFHLQPAVHSHRLKLPIRQRSPQPFDRPKSESPQPPHTQRNLDEKDGNGEE